MYLEYVNSAEVEITFSRYVYSSQSSFILFAIKRIFFWSNHLLDFTSGVHLQCCVSFRYTAECFSYTYTYIYYFSVSFLFFFFPSFSPSAVEETHIIVPSGATASSSLQLQQVFNMAQHRYASCCCSKTEFLLLSPEFTRFLQSQLLLPGSRGKN